MTRQIRTVTLEVRAPVTIRTLTDEQIRWLRARRDIDHQTYFDAGQALYGQRTDAVLERLATAYLIRRGEQ